MTGSDVEVLRESIRRATEDIERERDEWKVIAEELAEEIRRIACAFCDAGHRQALAAFDRKVGYLPGSSEE